MPAYLFLFHLAAAAFLAISDRLSGVKASCLAAAPALARRFFGVKCSPVICCKTLNAATFGSLAGLLLITLFYAVWIPKQA